MRKTPSQLLYFGWQDFQSIYSVKQLWKAACKGMKSHTYNSNMEKCFCLIIYNFICLLINIFYLSTNKNLTNLLFWGSNLTCLFESLCRPSVAFEILRILDLFTCKICIFLKKQANIFLKKQTFWITKERKSRKVKGVIMRNLSSFIFYMKTNILQNFHSALVYLSIVAKLR